MMSTILTTVETAQHAGIPVFTIVPGSPIGVRSSI
jgi:hypothetical protein